MIKLDNNYSIRPDGTHGFTLIFEGEPIEKKVKGEVRMVIPKDQWFFPKLSQTLHRYFTVCLGEVDSSKELISKVTEIEKNIESFKKVFAKNGKSFEVK